MIEEIIDDSIFLRIFENLLEIISQEMSKNYKKGRKRKESRDESEDFILKITKKTCFKANSIKIADVQATCSKYLLETADKMAQQNINKLVNEVEYCARVFTDFKSDNDIQVNFFEDQG